MQTETNEIGKITVAQKGQGKPAEERQFIRLALYRVRYFIYEKKTENY